MTLKEKIGQLFMLGFTGTSVSTELAALMAEYRPGGLIVFARNLESSEQIVELTNDLQGLSPDSPLLLAIDQEGGRVSRLPAGFTIFPPCAVLGRCGSTDLAYAAAKTTAAELRAVGLNMNMAPVLDLNTNPANPIIGDRAFSEEPAQVGELGVATMKGLQDHHVVACGKHFPGHGDTTADSHKELPVVHASAHRLRELELRPFQHAIANGLTAIMTAHVLYPKLDAERPATLSPFFLNTILREELGFTGVIYSDDLEMNAIIDHYGIEEASVLAFRAGVDVLLICKDQDRAVKAMEALYRATTDGTISAERIEASLRRVTELKNRFILPWAPADSRTAKEIVGSAEHRSLLTTIRKIGAHAAGADDP